MKNDVLNDVRRVSNILKEVLNALMDMNLILERMTESALMEKEHELQMDDQYQRYINRQGKWMELCVGEEDDGRRTGSTDR